MKSFLVVIECAESNYSAYCLDDIACMATGATIDETLRLMREGIALWIESTIDDGGTIPEARGLEFYVNSGEYMFAPNDILASISVAAPEFV
jgi:predicted RNase H-like HicB family nuclease